MKKLIRVGLKFFKWTFITVLILLVCLFIGIETVDRYLSTERGVLWLLSEMPYPPEKVKFTKSGVRYLEMGEKNKPSLLLIHGAPGGPFDWIVIGKQEELYEHFRLIIVERPGYGGTLPRKAEPSVVKQARRIAEVLNAENAPATVLGHSYGAPIAVAMGAVAPQKIKKIYGVSGQYDPDNEITFTISYFINFKIFRYLIPRFIWSSNVEKLNHPEALEEANKLYKTIDIPVIVVHGDEDSLVLYENAPFLMRQLNGSKELITLEGKNHPLHVTEADRITEIILEHTDN